MMKVGTLVSRQIVGILVITYSIGFWRSASRLPDGAAVIYPQLVIVALVSFIVADLVVTSVKAAKGRIEPAVAPPAQPDPDSFDGDEVVASVGDDGDAARDLTVELPVPGTVRGAIAGVWAEHHKTVATTIATLVYLIVIPLLGFYATTALFLPALFAYLGMRRSAAFGALWVASVAGIWLLFDLLLSVRLPGGILF